MKLLSWKNVVARYVRHSSTQTVTLQKNLRHLMLQTAQPVVVVTTRFREGSQFFRVPQDETSSNQDRTTLHGATISSFSSVAMHPYPVVAFSLQLPSRLATALNSMRNSTHKDTALPDFVINILSSEQADLAVRFSRPDRFPHPFNSLPPEKFSFIEDQPMLTGSIGSISCAIISSVNLRTLKDSMKAARRPRRGKSKNRNQSKLSDETTSNLFLAKVLRIDGFNEPEAGTEGPLPLVYHHKKFTTIK